MTSKWLAIILECAYRFVCFTAFYANSIQTILSDGLFLSLENVFFCSNSLHFFINYTNFSENVLPFAIWRVSNWNAAKKRRQNLKWLPSNQVSISSFLSFGVHTIFIRWQNDREREELMIKLIKHNAEMKKKGFGSLLRIRKWWFAVSTPANEAQNSIEWTIRVNEQSK